MAKCDLCKHRAVCHFMEQYTKLEKELPATNFPFTSAIICNEYIEEKPIPREYCTKIGTWSTLRDMALQQAYSNQQTGPHYK